LSTNGAAMKITKSKLKSAFMRWEKAWNSRSKNQQKRASKQFHSKSSADVAGAYSDHLWLILKS